jgi:hypothetical protein
MAITVKHKFVSAIPDAGDTTIVQPSNWNDDHDLVGTIPVANGGTGASTATDGLNNLLPSQTSNTGKVLTTDGTNASWVANGSGTVTSVTGTAPVNVATGTTTPVVSLAASYGDTQNPYASKTANYVLAAPDGSAGVPTFRALTATDIPSLTGTYIPYTGASSAIDLNAKTVVNISNLGINTTTVPTISMRAVGNNNSSSRIAMRGYSSDASSSAIRVTKFRGTAGAPQAPQSGDSLGKFELAGYGTTSSEGYPQASLEGLATEAWGATARGTKAVIKVTPNTTITQVTALTIDQNSAATFASSVTATSFSGSGSGLTGVVTSVATAGTVNGLTLTGGPITSTGTITLGGTLDLSSPPTIGNTAPNTGKFTTLEATGTTTLGTTSTTYVTITGDASYPMVKATGGTNTPLVLSPLGTGALQAQKTDSTATGGNARGANAVDWQTLRANAAQVASSANSIIVGGQSNTASSSYSTVVGGLSNTSSNTATFIGAGNSNTANGIYSVVVGGLGNSGATYNFIGGGQNNSGTSNSVVTSNTTTIAVTAGTTFYLSSTNANIKVGQIVFGTGLSANTYATSTVTTGTAAVMATSSISGTTLTVGSVSSGTIVAGQVLTGTGVTAGTYIVSGSGLSWVVSVSQTVSSTTITGTAYTFTISQNATTAAGVTLSFYTPHGVVVGGGNNQATGSYSFIGGGGDAGTAANRNVASGDWSFVGGGKKNTVTATGSAIVAGGIGQDGISIAGNSVSGLASFIGAGYSNNITGNYGTIGGGSLNTLSGVGSSIIGGRYGTDRTISGNTVFSANNSPIAASSGVSQSALLILGRQTTDATATVLTSDPSAASGINQVILPNNSAYYFKVRVIAGVTGAGDTKAWTLEGAIKRGVGVGTAAIVGTVTTTIVAADAGASTWTVTATADTTNGGLKITVTGQAATTIRWVAKAETAEMTY